MVGFGHISSVNDSDCGDAIGLFISIMAELVAIDRGGWQRWWCHSVMIVMVEMVDGGNWWLTMTIMVDNYGGYIDKGHLSDYCG